MVKEIYIDIKNKKDKIKFILNDRGVFRVVLSVCFYGLFCHGAHKHDYIYIIFELFFNL